jgi:hypothetical protein
MPPLPPQITAIAAFAYLLMAVGIPGWVAGDTDFIWVHYADVRGSGGLPGACSQILTQR